MIFKNPWTHTSTYDLKVRHQGIQKMDQRKFKDRPHVLDLSYGVFWDEYKTIEEECGANHKEAGPHLNGHKETNDEDNEIEWFNDAGFASIVHKYKESKEVDPNDDDIKNITSSLTRAQAAVVRKRIKSLNESIRRRSLENKKKSGKHSEGAKQQGKLLEEAKPLKRPEDSKIGKRPDVRTLFPVPDARTLFPVATEAQPTSSFPTTTYEPRNQPRPLLSPEPRYSVDSSTFYYHVDGLEPQSNKFFLDGNANKVNQKEKPDVRLSKSPPPIPPKPTRPPPPRRTKSENIGQFLDERPNQRDRNHPRSPSEGSPIRVEELAERPRSSLFPANVSSPPPELPRRRLSDAASYRRIPSPRADRHLQGNNGDSTQPQSPRKEGVTKRSSDLTGIEGDAKLSIGSSQPLKDQDSFPGGSNFPPLPNFSLTKEELGMTRVGDLSEQDMVKVRSLALIELTALFDTYGISMNRRKPLTKLKQKDTGVFGVSLTTLAQKDEGRKEGEPKAPRFFQELISFLETNGLNEEGVLRVPGSTQRVKALREEIEERYFDTGFFRWEGRRSADVATLLKQFVREQPVPLLTHEYQNTFIAVSGLKDRKLQLQALNLLVLMLPSVHRDTLKLLLSFLGRVTCHEQVNKMGLNNIAMIMAPNLFFQANSRASMDEIQKAAAVTDIMRMLIKYQVILWTVPGFMVTQIRYLYEAGAKGRDPKAVRKIIAKRMKNGNLSVSPPKDRNKLGGSGDEVDGVESDENVNIIRVKAPMFNKICMAIQVYDNTTAGDIIAKFRWRRNSVRELSDIGTLTAGTRSPTAGGRSPELSKSDSNLSRDEEEQFCLYEAGGNIGERCLDPDANMQAVLKVNPNAEWILKCKAFS